MVGPVAKILIAAVLMYVSTVLHEVAHYLAAAHYGISGAYIRVVSVGGVPSLAYTYVPVESGHMAIYLPPIALAGPLMSLMLSTVMAAVMKALDDWASGLVASVNAALCATNTFPSFEMVNFSFRILPLNDGGKAIYYASMYPGMHVLCWALVLIIVSLSVVIIAYGIKYITLPFAE